MYFTAQYGHFEKRPNLKFGQKLKYGDVIGVMGTSGQSKWPHLHLHVIRDFHRHITRLRDIYPKGLYIPAKRQLKFFADKDLFGVRLVQTTPYNSKKYREAYGKPHYALDLVPFDRHTTNAHFTVRWNRSFTGTVLDIGFDKYGYGYYAVIGYDTE